MRQDKTKAVILRKQGKSYNQISAVLHIPKSTLSYWLKNIQISKKAKQKISERVFATSIASLIRRNKQQTVLAAQRADLIRNQAKKEVSRLIKNPLFVTGISLYWAEGYKKGAQGSKWKSVDFANSDPEMIELAMKFFRQICEVNIENIKIQLIAHPNVDVEKATSFWSLLTKIPKSQFIKTCCSISKYSRNKRKKNSLKYGTIHIRINDVKLFFKIIGWIDGLKSQLKGSVAQW